MHAVRRALVAMQAERLGLPLHLVELPSPCPNDRYEDTDRGALAEARDAGVDQIVFGDLFLADVPRTASRRSRRRAWGARFPLWDRPTDVLAREIRRGRQSGGHLRRSLAGPCGARRTTLGRGTSRSCRRAPIPVVRTENSTRSYGTARNSTRRSPSSLVRPSNATASSSATCARPPDHHRAFRASRAGVSRHRVVRHRSVLAHAEQIADVALAPDALSHVRGDEDGSSWQGHSVVAEVTRGQLCGGLPYGGDLIRCR